nr:MAG TPA: hypothetical protein [Caudoviricetes sp.]
MYVRHTLDIHSDCMSYKQYLAYLCTLFIFFLSYSNSSFYFSFFFFTIYSPPLAHSNTLMHVPV